MNHMSKCLVTELAPRLCNFFMLNSTEHEISAAHKKTKIPKNKDFSCFKGDSKPDDYYMFYMRDK